MLKRCFSSLTNFFKAAGWTSPELNHTGKPEDAYTLNPKLIALCDGHSKWREQGIDPGLHSWQLVSNIQKSYTSLPDPEKQSPLSIIKSALSNTSEPGSSTFIISILHPEKQEIYTSWLGDSSMLILRKEENQVSIVGQTDQIVTKFDDPKVIGYEGSSLEEAKSQVFQIKDKDIVLLFSDGVSHNLTIESILKTIKPFMLLHEIPDLEIVAEMITEKAQSHFLDASIEKPYGVQTNRPTQGKNNDATVVIAEVNLRDINV